MRTILVILIAGLLSSNTGCTFEHSDDDDSHNKMTSFCRYRGNCKTSIVHAENYEPKNYDSFGEDCFVQEIKLNNKVVGEMLVCAQTSPTPWENIPDPDPTAYSKEEYDFLITQNLRAINSSFEGD